MAIFSMAGKSPQKILKDHRKLFMVIFSENVLHDNFQKYERGFMEEYFGGIVLSSISFFVLNTDLISFE